MCPQLARLLLAALFFGVGLDVQAHILTTYFVVAESGAPVHGDSYVLPLEDPSHIAHARDLIARGIDAGSPIVVAQIAKGQDGINRDYLAPGEPLWSWHVTRFEGFADSTIELIDGWPTFVEQDIDGWIANTGGFIGFWSYTVVAEVTRVPEAETLLLVAVGLGGLVVIRLVSNRRRHDFTTANPRLEHGNKIPHAAARLVWPFFSPG